jgi:hypothetical protein
LPACAVCVICVICRYRWIKKQAIRGTLREEHKEPLEEKGAWGSYGGGGETTLAVDFNDSECVCGGGFDTLRWMDSHV